MITLKLRYHAFNGETLSRSIFTVKFYGRTRFLSGLFRRFAGPQWQEQIHNGEWHNLTQPRIVDGLEAAYQQFIVDNPDTFSTGTRLNS